MKYKEGDIIYDETLDKKAEIIDTDYEVGSGKVWDYWLIEIGGGKEGGIDEDHENFDRICLVCCNEENHELLYNDSKQRYFCPFCKT